MGCGCGKKKPGGSMSDPIFFGEDNNEPPVQVTTTIAISRRKASETVWAAGSQLQTMINAGWLTPAGG